MSEIEKIAPVVGRHLTRGVTVSAVAGE
jgi:hypothetical protein